MIIKRWDGTAFVEEHPKTKAQLIFNNTNDNAIFDGNDKIKPAYLPDSVFDSLYFSGTTTGNVGTVGSRGVLASVLISAYYAADALNRSMVGFYWVISTTGTITGVTGIQASLILDGEPGYQEYATIQFRPQDAGSNASPDTSSSTLEVGDWFVIESVSGLGTSGSPYIFTAAVINNSYELATTSIDGVVRLSDATTYASLTGNHVVTEGILKTVIDNAGFAAGNHVHGNITNNGSVTATVVAPANTDTILISDASNGGKVERGITIGTATNTFLRNDGTWVAPVGTTYNLATSTVAGLVEVGSDTQQTVAANAVTATASRTYASQLNAAGQLVVNVPWVDTNTTYNIATATTAGIVEVFSDTDQTVAANAVSATAGRTYGIQLNADNQMVVNVPWSDTNTTYSKATTTALGLVEVAFADLATTPTITATTNADRYYGVQLNSAQQMVVNVPWVDTNTTYSVATATTPGLVELFSNTDQSVAANAVTTTAGRTYGLQLNSANQGVINVPWTDTISTAATGGGLSVTSNAFSMVNPFFAQADAPASPVTGTIWFDL
jgi:hypothetical protein